MSLWITPDQAPPWATPPGAQGSAQGSARPTACPPAERPWTRLLDRHRHDTARFPCMVRCPFPIDHIG
jgi:hypothetical protein